MTVTYLGGLFPARGKATPAPRADYKSVDPAAFNVNTNGAKTLRLTVNVEALSGSGNTVTVTISGVSPEGSGSLYTLLSKTITSTGVKEFEVGPEVPVSNAQPNAQDELPRLCQIALVGSGTRTTLTYSASVEVSDN